MTEKKSGLTLYTAPTPNGWKVSVALAELNLPYEVVAINLLANDQKQPDFLALNPNGRIPVLVDHDADELVIFESGAILIYLAEKTGKLLSQDPRERMAALQWLMFQMGGIGPMMGQANVFSRYLPEKIPVAIDRYQNECRRLFEVLDTRLGQAEWLAGAEYSIADIANWCWVRTYRWSGVNIDGLENLRRWLDVMKLRSACQLGVTIPVPMPSLSKPDDQAASDFANAARTLVQR